MIPYDQIPLHLDSMLRLSKKNDSSSRTASFATVFALGEPLAEFQTPVFQKYYFENEL